MGKITFGGIQFHPNVCQTQLGDLHYFRTLVGGTSELGLLGSILI